MFDVFQLGWVEFGGFGMSFVCCFLCLGFSENRQFAPRTPVRAAKPLAETLEILNLLSSRRDPLLAPRTAWQKVGDFCICSVRAATLVGAANCLAESWGFWIRSVR